MGESCSPPITTVDAGADVAVEDEDDAEEEEEDDDVSDGEVSTFPTVVR